VVNYTYLTHFHTLHWRYYSAVSSGAVWTALKPLWIWLLIFAPVLFYPRPIRFSETKLGLHTPDVV